MKTVTIFIATCLGATGLYAQSMSGELKMQWDDVKGNILKAADRMSDADYSFKPEGEPRTFAQLITHVADAQAMMCGAATGEMKPVNAGAKTSKADIMSALKASTDACDAAYNGLTDANATQTVKMFGRDRTKYGALDMNVIHDNEVYGSIAVYMRLKNIVPPSTADRPQMGKKKE